MSSSTTEPGPSIEGTPSDPQGGSASSAMAQEKDRFVTNYDALKLVFSLFVPPLMEDNSSELPPLAVGGRKQLYDLAFVCKAFYDPALDCLWWNLPGIKPLLQLHPALKIIDGVYCFLSGRFFDLNKVKKFEKYARRVRGIRLGQGPPTPPRVSFASYAWLGQQRETCPLLPALREICFEGPSGDTEQMGLLSLMLSPLIETIRFHGPFIFNEMFTAYAFPVTCNGARSMQHLSLQDQSSTSHGGIWDALPKLAGALPISTLNIRFPYNLTLPRHLLRRLATRFGTLSSLTLDIHTPSHGASEDIPTSSFSSTLPALTFLHIINRSHTGICQCYPQSLLERATSVTLVLTSSANNAGAFQAAVDTLATFRSLKGVVITEESPGANITVSPSAITPFLGQLSLEEFHVDVWGLELEDRGSPGKEIRDLVGAPVSGDPERGVELLRSLRLPMWRTDIYTTDYRGRRYHQGPAPYPPLDCLAHISQNAPGLTHATLSIDSSAGGSNGETLKSLLEEWSRPNTPSALRHLELLDMRPAGTPFAPMEYNNIGRLLDVIFPNLDTLSIVKHQNGPNTWNDHWKAIEEYRRMHKELRLYRSGRF